MNETSPKQQIVDRIKKATNILVTVSKNPSVDELSSAIGLTLMLNKLGKHATAVYSGVTPAAITFLDPSKTLENTVDSLRDFIIALDKEKADRLRYRVEDDVVRIFITPYRTKITQDDLEFTHGDFNVELVLGLGVENQDDLDEAIAAHGKILHDATVATVSTRGQKSTLGSIDWQDEQASSLCEMLVAISESIKDTESLLDEQTATALLTGIVSATNRFSNDQTSPKAMTMAAQLMAAGANQQLIAAQLEESQEITSQAPKEQPPKENTDGSIDLNEDDSESLRATTDVPEEIKEESDEKDLGEMTINHEEQIEDDPFTPVSDTTLIESKPEEQVKPPMIESATIEEHDRRNKKLAGEEALDAALNKLNATTTAVPGVDIAAELTQTQTAEQETPSRQMVEEPLQEPSMGGSFNATIEEAAEAKRREEESGRNKVIMSHGGAVQVPEEHESVVSTKAATIEPPRETLADIEAHIKQDAAAIPNLPAIDPASTTRQEIDNLFNTTQENTSAGMIPPLPPLPDFSTLPPLPGIDAPQTEPQTTIPVVEESVAPPPAPVTPDQFRIPGA